MIPMILAGTSLILGIVMVLYGYWRHKNYLRLPPPLLSPFLLQFVGLILMVAGGASLVSLTTGVSWQSPRFGAG